MARQELNVLGGFYKDPNLHWSAQDVLNWIPVPGEKVGTRTRFQFRDAPGFKPFVRITKRVSDGEGFITVDQGPIRGMRNVEGKLFVVAGTVLYQITNSGVAVPYGTIPGVGRVSMAHNERGGGNQLLVVNGSAGYVLDTSSLVFQKITDTGYPGAFIADFADGYLAQVEPQGRYWLHSDLSQALDYNTFDQYEAEADPDRIISLHVAFREVLIFGADTIEPFVNTGRAQGTFQRASNTVIQCGCSAKFSPRTMDNAVFFLDDKRVVRRMDGYNPVRISTVGIEAALAECSREEIASAFAVTYEDRGHKIYYLTVPGRFTFGYDVLSKEWHRRGSPGMGRWRLSDLVFWNGKWIGGDFQSGRLYELDWAYSLDSCDVLERERVTGVLSADQNPITLNEVELLFNPGGKVSRCVAFPVQPEAPTISGTYPDGIVGEEIAEYTYTATGGAPPYTFSNRPGNAPAPGISAMASDGVVAESTPTTAGNYTHRPRVTDANGLYDDLSDPYVIDPAPIDWMMVVNDSDALLFGLNGDWTGPLQPSPGSEFWQVAAWGNGELLMNDRSNAVAFSTNKGSSWTVSTLPATVAGNKGYVYFANGYWWIPSGSITEVQRGNGITFTQPASGTAARGEAITSVTGDPLDTLVMVAASEPKSSFSLDNGVTWNFGSGNMRAGALVASKVGIASNGTRCVIGGAFSAAPNVIYSDNAGDTWTAVATDFTGSPSFVIYRDGKFVIGTSLGEIGYSEDGETWTMAGDTGATGQRCNGIDYDGTRWTAIFGNSDISGFVFESLDDMATWDAKTVSSGSTAQYAVIAMTP